MEQQGLKRGAVAVIRDGERILFIRRGPDVALAGYWSPPSGSIEPGETVAETLVREMGEELGIVARPIREVWTCLTEDGSHRLEWWLTEIADGTPHPVDGEVAEVRWITADDFDRLSPTFDAHRTFLEEVWPSLIERGT